MQRRPIETLAFPPDVLPVDLPTLADALGDRHDATIVGSDGGYELRLGTPSTLIVVLSPAQVDFFEDVAPHEPDDDDPTHPFPEEDSMEAGVERVVHTIEQLLGLYVEEADEHATDDEHDDADRAAKLVLARLLEEGSIELVAPRSRAGVEGKLAHLIARGADAATVLDGLTDHEGVAEIYADERRLATLLSSARRRRR